MPKEDTQFKPGQVANPKGRPKGSKNKLSDSFLRALAENFEKHGKEAIEQVCKNSPGEYLRIIAGLMPKELMLEVNHDEPRWVINAQPLSIDEWSKENGILPATKVIDSPESVPVVDKPTK